MEVNVGGLNEVTEELMESGKGGRQVADGKKLKWGGVKGESNSEKSN